MIYRVDGYSFGEKIIADRYLMLKLLKANKKIKDFFVYPRFVLVKAYHKCPCCEAVSTDEVCKLCNSKTYSSKGITFPVDFLVCENDGRKIVEKVMEALILSHEFNMKKILYDQIYPHPLRIVVHNVRYRKTEKGWVSERHASV